MGCGPSQPTNNRREQGRYAYYSDNPPPKQVDHDDYPEKRHNDRRRRVSGPKGAAYGVGEKRSEKGTEARFRPAFGTGR